jgi:hypothetical protein
MLTWLVHKGLHGCASKEGALKLIDQDGEDAPCAYHLGDYLVECEGAPEDFVAFGEFNEIESYVYMKLTVKSIAPLSRAPTAPINVIPISVRIYGT